MPYIRLVIIYSVFFIVDCTANTAYCQEADQDKNETDHATQKKNFSQNKLNHRALKRVFLHPNKIEKNNPVINDAKKSHIDANDNAYNRPKAYHNEAHVMSLKHNTNTTASAINPKTTTPSAVTSNAVTPSIAAPSTATSNTDLINHGQNTTHLQSSTKETISDNSTIPQSPNLAINETAIVNKNLKAKLSTSCGCDFGIIQDTLNVKILPILKDVYSSGSAPVCGLGVKKELHQGNESRHITPTPIQAHKFIDPKIVYPISANVYCSGQFNISAPIPAITKKTIYYYHHNNGINIKDISTADVLAVNNGTVLYSATSPNIGQVICIGHKNSIISVYVIHGSRLVKKGDKVRSGQKIGSIGENKSLYFSIRDGDNNILDPLKYTKELNMKEVKNCA
ncbi:M23 family metallopeptidase [Rickettsiales bacterium]|nr:M23 family metallopeptidase [Rickettsiales bacterium]